VRGDRRVDVRLRDLQLAVAGGELEARVLEREPRPSSPSRFSAGTSTSSKNSSAVSCECVPSFSRLRPRSKPFMPFSMITTLMSSWRPVSPVRTAVTITSAFSPFEMNVLAPDTTYEPLRRRARVVIPATSEPAPGSDIAIAAMSSPDARPGSQRSFCSSVPSSRM
jgi:hypothetical protein